MSEKSAPYVAGSPVSNNHPTSRVYRGIREAIHAAAHGYGCLKTLAGDLDMSPSGLSMCTVLSDGESARPFPAEKLGDLCHNTGNMSPLLTLADQLGYVCISRDELHAVAADLDRHARSLRGER
jgi:hypothetical protein